MKSLYFVAGLVFFLLASVISGATTDPAADIRSANAASSDMALAAMLENEARLAQLIESMEREMELLQTVENEGERRRLIESHQGHLHETLMLLRVTGGYDISRIIDAQHPELTGTAVADPEIRIGMLERRVDMMQIVMEAMLEHMTMQGRARP